MSAVSCLLWERLERELANAKANADTAKIAVLRLVEAARVAHERLHGPVTTEKDARAIVFVVCEARETAAVAFEAAGRSDLAEIERNDAALVAALLGVSRG